MRTALISAAAVMTVFAAGVMVGNSWNSDAEAEIRAVVRAYATASAAGDGQRVCALMTSGSRARFATGLGKDCASWMRAFTAELGEAGRDAYRRLAISAVVIDDSTAEVELSRFGDEAGGSLSLAKRGDRWLLDFEGPGRVEVVTA